MPQSKLKIKKKSITNKSNQLDKQVVGIKIHYSNYTNEDPSWWPITACGIWLPLSKAEHINKKKKTNCLTCIKVLAIDKAKKENK